MIVYIKPDCPYSRGLVRWLARKRRPVTEINVLNDKFQYEKMLKLSGGVSGTPVWVEEDGTINVGFRGHYCPIDKEDLPWT